ncbi:MAG: hypothetical protein ACLRMZ_00430 [Blautia marasmi]
MLHGSQGLCHSLLVFAKLGVKLSGIECANGSMIRLLDKMEQLRGKTCIVQFVDEMNDQCPLS